MFDLNGLGFLVLQTVFPLAVGSDDIQMIPLMCFRGD